MTIKEIIMVNLRRRRRETCHFLSTVLEFLRIDAWIQTQAVSVLNVHTGVENIFLSE